MIRSLTGAALLLWAGSLLAQSLPGPVQRALNTAQIPTSSVALVVQAVDAPSPLLRLNDQAPMNPASVMKLVTTYVALDTLGPAATWQTEARVDALPDAAGILKGNLYLKGSGDPRLALENFWALLRQLRVRGVKDIDGDLILDRSLFDLPPHDPAAFDNKPMRAYNVGPDALLVDYRALRFTLRPEGDGVRFWSESPSDGLKVQARITPSKGVCNGWRDLLDVRLNGNQLDINGSYPVACGEKSLYLAPLEANRHLDGLFRALWKELGGSLKGRVRSGPTPPEALVLASQESPPLADMVRDINKWSNNVMARQLFLTLGADGNGPATEEKARQRVKAWAQAKGLNAPELVLENGSGLSRVARISAASLNRLLLDIWRGPLMPEMLASLPIAGEDGTLKKRLNGTEAAGRSRLKTGTLDGVKTMAGYVQDGSGRRYAVTFLINHPKAGQGQEAMDALLIWLSQGGQTP